MARVVLLRGVNVGGHRTFRPSAVAKALKCDAVNIGAAGTFVVRQSIGRVKLRSKLTRLLPFDTHIMICDGRELLRVVASDPFAGQPSGPQILQFLGVVAKRTQRLPPIPLALPSDGAWALKVFTVDDKFVLGVCRREMTAIGYLGKLDEILGVPVTTRSWNTIQTIVRTLNRESRSRKWNVGRVTRPSL